MAKIAILGYSGHAFVMLDACKKSGINITYYCEREELSFNPYKLKYFGNETSKDFAWQLLDGFVLGIGDNYYRKKAVEKISLNNKKIFKIIHPSAIINEMVTIGEGSLVCSNAVINPLATIGEYCIINTASIVEHECKIESGVHIGPGAVLAGNVRIGSLSFIGANSVIKQGVSIGNNVTIGAGSVVLNDVHDNEVWVGNPAKKIR